MPARYSATWSKTRLRALIATAPAPPRVGVVQDDEAEFFATEGIRRELARGSVLVKHGDMASAVHLVERGVVGVLGIVGDRRPVLALATAGEVTCAVPVLLQTAMPWDVVTITDALITTVPANRFVEVVRQSWADRWTSRILAWLAEVGECQSHLEAGDLEQEIGAFLLRRHARITASQVYQAFADRFDVATDEVRQILDGLSRRGAVRVVGDHVSIADADTLRALSAR